MKCLINYCILLILPLALVGCGFHLRNASKVPPELHALYFDPVNAYDPVVVDLRETLMALHVTMTHSPQQAAYTLHLSKSIINNTQPSLSDITLATTVSFSQSITASLIDNKTKKIIITHEFSESIVQTLNQNQVTTNSTTTLGTQDLPRNLVNDLYLWLTTNQVYNALKAK